ncbi:MAG: hypothetical protein ACLQVI_07375 [Polyangiaceae bacterium]
MDRPVPNRSPFPPGGSPWCQKGNVYRSLFQHVDAYVEGGSAAALARIDDKNVRNYLSQPFVASGWYDIFPMITMVVEVARMRGVPYFTAVSDLSRMMAEADLNGIYRTLLRVVAPRFLAPRLPRIQGQYLNFGTLTVTESEWDHCEVLRGKHPQLLFHWYVAVVQGFLPCVLECSGAKDVRVRWSPPEAEGKDEAGFEMVGLRFTIHWA